MLNQTTYTRAKTVPLLSVNDRLYMQAIENLRRSCPEGRELFEDLCCDTHDTLVRLQTLPATLPIEFAVKREVSRLALERQRAQLVTH